MDWVNGSESCWKYETRLRYGLDILAVLSTGKVALTIQI